jgi:hypothetical protein
MILKQITCDICYAIELETEENAGWKGWGQLQGAAIDDFPNPNLCPKCLSQAASFLDSLKNKG